MFDFGGVICTPIVEMMVELAEHHEVEIPELLTVLLGPPESTADHPWHRGERGELPTSAFQAEVEPFARAAGLQLRGDEYAILLAGNFEIDSSMVDMVSEVGRRGMRTALLTNSFVEFQSVIAARLDLGLFDVVVDSSNEGCRKPDRAIFDITAERLDVEPEAIVFLDDFAGNIAGAFAAGWTGIQVDDPVRARNELRQLLAV